MLAPYHEADKVEAGCDEAGRGCLAGPVFAAAVILPSDFDCPGLNDSKQLGAEQRRALRKVIEEGALAWAVAWVEEEDIDRLNILWASIEAMHRAVGRLSLRPDSLLVDGNRFRAYEGIPHRCVVGGDAKYRSIAAASILAKTWRDERMEELARRFPGYGWEQNKGYPTASHRAAIRLHGPSPHHRKSFRLLPDGQGRLF
jgi:ribonuclease HII